MSPCSTQKSAPEVDGLNGHSNEIVSGNPLKVTQIFFDSSPCAMLQRLLEVTNPCHTEGAPFAPERPMHSLAAPKNFRITPLVETRDESVAPASEPSAGRKPETRYQ